MNPFSRTNPAAQPFVVVHETQDRRFVDEKDGWTFAAYVENAGAGPAVNVRFGIEMHGIRWPLRFTEADPKSGHRIKVAAAGARFPHRGEYELLVPSLDLLGALSRRLPKQGSSAIDAELDTSRIYWCRFEDALGRTWETRNPSEPAVPVRMRRARRANWFEKHEGWELEEVQEEGRRWADSATSGGVSELDATRRKWFGSVRRGTSPGIESKPAESFADKRKSGGPKRIRPHKL